MAEEFFRPRLIENPSFRTEAKRFIEAGPDALVWISTIVDQTGNFELEPDTQIEGTRLGLSPEDLLSLSRIASFIYDHSKHLKSSPQALSQEIERLGLILKAKASQGWEKAFISLLSPKGKYDRRKAITLALEQGPATLRMFSLAVDARAVSETDSGKLLGFVPTVLGRVTINLDITEEKRLEFTLGKEKLIEMKHAVERAITELEALTKDLEGKLLS